MCLLIVTAVIQDYTRGRGPEEVLDVIAGILGRKRKRSKIAPAILNVINALYELHEWLLFELFWLGNGLVFVTLGISIVQMSYLITCNAVHFCWYEI